MKKTITGLVALLLSVFAGSMAFADGVVWYVDGSSGDDSNSGETLQSAKKTIQAAVDKAGANDIVKVAEGIYVDTNTYNNAKACVIVTKNLTIVATGSKDKTHIVGRHADTSNGIGEGAVRCVYVKNGSELRLEGFTIRDGAVAGETADDYGGGVKFSVHTEANGYLVDCVVSNCVAARGGALQYGTAVRCLLTGNNSTSHGLVASQSILYNCLVVENHGGQRLFNHPRAIVNCSIAGNTMGNFSYSTANHYLYNTVVLENSSASFCNPYAVLSNCLIKTGTSGIGAAGLCATNDTGACFVAPALGDWRVRSDSRAANLGDAAHLSLVTLPDESLRYVDYAGKPIAQSSAITCGAIQHAPLTESGTLVLDGSFEVKGVGNADLKYCNYLHATNYPVMYSLKAVDATISNIVWYSSTTGLAVRVPTLEGWVGVMPPPSGAMTVKPVYATTIFYADAQNGDDDYKGSDIGSWDHPFKTLQAAVDATPAGNSDSALKYSVVCVKRGDYRDNFSEVNLIRRRLYIQGHRRVRVVALDGPEHTFIHGASVDEENPSPCLCVGMKVPSVVQGFTLTGGFAGSNGAAFDCDLNVSDRILADSRVLNNVSESFIQKGGTSVRCMFLNNKITFASGGELRNGWTVGSIFRSSGDSDLGSYILGGSAESYFTTYISDSHSSAKSVCGLVIDDAGKFIDSLNDDYRLRSDSPAFGGGDPDPENYWKFANLDMDGNGLCFMGARPTAGAYQYPAALALAVAAPVGMVKVGDAGAMTNAVLSGATVTIEKADDCGRNLLGFMLPDGSFCEGQSYAYTAPVEPLPGAVDVVAAVFSTNWYVNAGEKGNDLNDGFTPETPKKTLAGVMSAAVLPGDTVHAAQGDYGSREMYHEKDIGNHGGEAVIGSRVVVPAGVTLVADEGADVTHIVGAAASQDQDAGFGLGSNAVRCAVLLEGARLKGFTLRDGHTNARDIYEDCNCAGGVLGVSSLTSYVEDCVISNCVAMYGGAGYNASFTRCRFFRNRALQRASVTRISYHDSCVADWNQGTRPFDYFLLMTNCTIGANQIDENGVAGNGYALVQPGNVNETRVIDCLVLGKIHDQVKMRRSAALSTSGVKEENCEYCILTNIAALAIDNVNYRPVIGENVAIDAVPLTDADRAAKDVYGVQRVFNGARDLGALDADWRGHYAKTLGGRGLVVTDADPAVVERNGALRIKEGSLCIDWKTPGDAPRTHVMDVSVSGGGEMSVMKNGELFVSVTEGTSGIRKFRSSGSSRIEFSFAADDLENSYGEVKSLRIPFGTAISIR